MPCLVCNKKTKPYTKLAEGFLCEKCSATSLVICGVCGGNTLKHRAVNDENYGTSCPECSPERVCSVSGKSFHSHNPVRIIKGTRREVMSKDALRSIPKSSIAMCTMCGHRFWSDGSRWKELDDIDKVAVSCNRCFRRGSLPIKFSGVKEITGEGRKIGIEIECEPSVNDQIRMFKWRDRHKVAQVNGTIDTSLRGPYRVEYTSPILRESNFEDWLDTVGSKLTDAKVYNRCGLHFHISTDDASWFELNRLMRYCYIWQDTFAAMVSPSRLPQVASDHSGRPLVLPPEFIHLHSSKENLLRTLYGSLVHASQENLKGSKRANDQNGPKYPGCIHRYQWLNVHGHWYKGAIEIRLHQGTTNVSKIKRWIWLWLSIIDRVFAGCEDSPLVLAPKHIEQYYRQRISVFSEMRSQKGFPALKTEPNNNMATHLVAQKLVNQRIANAIK